ncbi:hypothetical protein NKDENANG_00920 [Candidatus Entotheonellaceae bacterium PAL068K]
MCAGGIVFLGFDFVVTELLYSLSMATGLGIAMKPQLDDKKDYPQWCTDQAGLENAPALPSNLNQTT